LKSLAPFLFADSFLKKNRDQVTRMVKVTEMVFITSDTDLCRHMGPQQNEECPGQQKEARGKGKTSVLNPVLPGKQKKITNE
jgi:hypothetical protein